MRKVEPSQISRVMLPSAKAVGYFFAGGMGRALHSYCIAFLGAHGHGHGHIMTLGHLGRDMERRRNIT